MKLLLKDRSRPQNEDDVLCFWCEEYHEEWPGNERCNKKALLRVKKERNKSRQILETFLLEMKYKLTIEYVPKEGWNARPYNTGWTIACYSKSRHVAVRKIVEQIELEKEKMKEQKRECNCY